jgi:RNA polymerase sigma factor (sigma-70 family)
MSGDSSVFDGVMKNPPRESDVDRSSDAVRLLFVERRLPMTRLAYVLTRDLEVADEIVQDSFVKVHENWDHVRNPSAYLRTAVVNGCHSYHRRLRIERSAPVDRARVTELAVDELGDAVARLPFKLRVTLALRYFCDLSDREIAAILDIRPATVRTRIHRGLVELRKEIQR